MVKSDWPCSTTPPCSNLISVTMPFTRARICASLMASTRPGKFTVTSVEVGSTVTTLTGIFIPCGFCSGSSLHAASKPAERSTITLVLCQPESRGLSIERLQQQNLLTGSAISVMFGKEKV